jgi:hypothetical protein
LVQDVSPVLRQREGCQGVHHQGGMSFALALTCCWLVYDLGREHVLMIFLFLSCRRNPLSVCRLSLPTQVCRLPLPTTFFVLAVSALHVKFVLLFWVWT